MVYQAISLYNTLTVPHNPNRLIIQITGMDSDRVPALVIKAATMISDRAGMKPEFHFQLAKTIPSEAGLRGGSVDAAATLNPLVPLKTSGHTWHWVPAVPHRGLSTKAVFQKYDELLAGLPASQDLNITPTALTIRNNGSFSGNHPEFIPRLGLIVSLPNVYNQATWFGRGPGESYRDKKESARFGTWTASLDQLQTAYEWPQENGNRIDVFWARLSCADVGADTDGEGPPVLEARMEQPCGFSL
ncbi:galactose mutarotase-like domain-containing protein [Aspergillus insuetus]